MIIKAGAATLNQTPLDWTGNENRIKQAIQSAKEKEVQILCLPELCISGAGCEDTFLSANTREQSLRILKNLIPLTDNQIVCFGLPLQFENKLYNTICLVAHQQIIGLVPKANIGRTGLSYDYRWFDSWNSNEIKSVEIDGTSYPFGKILFDIAGLKIRIFTGEDLKDYDQHDADLLLNPSADPFEFYKFRNKRNYLKAISSNTQSLIIHANLLGNEAGKLIFPGERLIIQQGEELAAGKRFSFEESDLTYSSVGIDIKNSSGQGKTNFNFFKFPESESTGSGNQLSYFEDSDNLKDEEFARALSLSLFDYLRKSKSNGYMISLSGGADSSACLVLCSLMIKLGIEDIGIGRFKGKLSHIRLEEKNSSDELMKTLVSTIYQGTQNSSESTLQAASELAQDCSSVFFKVNIDHIIQQYTEMIENQIGRKLRWETDDIPLQNIQARVRVPGVWLLANLNNFLLITTANRSEAAVGYCTMDGDTAGCLAPISGINKSWLREWLIWMEKEGLKISGETVRFESLKWVNSIQPTAELRPSAQKQTDEKDLMPYSILNQIEQMLVRDKLSPLMCYKALVANNEGYTKADLCQWVVKFFRMWSRNQWKRDRYASGFHLDEYNLDPVSWVRFPILNGSYQVEIEELEKYFASTHN